MENVITVRVDQEILTMLEQASFTKNKSKSEVIREALRVYTSSNKKSGGTFMLNIAKGAKRANFSASKDIIKNIDKYVYGV